MSSNIEFKMNLSIERDSSLSSSISTKETTIKSKKSSESTLHLESTIPLETLTKISNIIEDLNYTQIIEETLNTRKINYKIYEKTVWTIPNNIKNLQGKNMMIPGSKCEMLKSFIAVKFTSKTIYIVISSNRMVFNENCIDELQNFCNYVNETYSLGMFYTDIVKINENYNKAIIALKKNIIFDDWSEDSENVANEKKLILAREFIDEVVRIDKIFYEALIGNLPLFLMKYSIFKQIKKHINPNNQNIFQDNFEIGQKSVLKAIKGMGFIQEKKRKNISSVGDLYTIDCAVNIDPDFQGSNQGAKIIVTLIEVTNFMVTIKLKLCKDRTILTINHEKSIKILEEFINYANNDLKKAQFKINHIKGVVYLEGNFVYFGMDFTEIQAGFQDLLSYMIHTFKKYRSSILEIAVKMRNEENINFNAKDSYKEIMKIDFPEMIYEYSQFAVVSNSDMPGYMLIPKSFVVKKYAFDDYIKEKNLLQMLRTDIDEFYHISFNDETYEIRYPEYNGCSLRRVIYEIGKRGAKKLQSFIMKLHGKRFRIKNFMDSICAVKENRNYYFSIMALPYYNCIEYVEDGISKNESKELIAGITEEAFRPRSTQKIYDGQIDFINESTFDLIDYTSLTGYLIDKTVELLPISISEIHALESKKKLTLTNIDSYLGFLKAKNNLFYKVQEKLIPLHTKALSKPQIKDYFISIINTVMILYHTNSLPGIIKYEDLYLNSKNSIKIRFQNREKEQLWMGHMKKVTLEQKIMFSLSLLLYKMHVGVEFVDLFKCFNEEQLVNDFINGTRIPIVPWEFEMEEPRIAEFMKKCWKYEFVTLEDMKNAYPKTFVI